jgi:hypothetical protein
MVVTVIISAISVGVMLHCGRCQQQAGLPHFLMAEASGKQMLLKDEQQGGSDSGWAFSPEPQQIETSVLGRYAQDSFASYSSRHNPKALDMSEVGYRKNGGL